MALIRGDYARGLKALPCGDSAGEVICERFSIVIPAGTNPAVNDVIEIAGLPAFHSIVDATVVVDNLATTALDIGLVSGTFGENNGARTCGNELFAAQAAASQLSARMSKVVGFRMAPYAVDIGIGLKVLTAGFTGSGQVIDLILYYRA